jgi:hypothetical protein
MMASVANKPFKNSDWIFDTKLDAVLLKGKEVAANRIPGIKKGQRDRKKAPGIRKLRKQKSRRTRTPGEIGRSRERESNPPRY